MAFFTVAVMCVVISVAMEFEFLMGGMTIRLDVFHVYSNGNVVSVKFYMRENC